MSNLYANQVLANAEITSSNLPGGMRNRIMNGAMKVDQRNVGTSVTLNNSALFVTDRFSCSNGNSVNTTVQQTVLGSGGTAPPIIPSAPMFTNALTWTNSSTATATTNNRVYVPSTTIEGSYITDFMWGTALAKPVTLSFWVYASVAGPYSIGFQNSTLLTIYVTTYTITTPNSWQFVQLTIPGCKIGSWATDNSAGLCITWTIHGSTNSSATSSLNSWATQTAQYYISSNQTNLLATASSKFAITGIQLEVGNVATPYEWRSFDTEIRQCQRYFEKTAPYGTLMVPGSYIDRTSCIYVVAGAAGNSTVMIPGRSFMVEKRTVPNLRIFQPDSGQLSAVQVVNIAGAVNAVPASNYLSAKGYTYIDSNGTAFTSGTVYYYHYDATADFSA